MLPTLNGRIRTRIVVALVSGGFLLQLPTTWIVGWLVVDGPMQVPFGRRRFRGGRLV